MHYLPIVYLIPDEIAEKQGFANFPRNPYIAATEDKWLDVYNSNYFQMNLMDTISWMMWQHLGIRGGIENYSIRNPISIMVYDLGMWVWLLAEVGIDLDALSALPHGEEIPFLTMEESAEICNALANAFWNHPDLKMRKVHEIVNVHRSHDPPRRTPVSTLIISLLINGRILLRYDSRITTDVTTSSLHYTIIYIFHQIMNMSNERYICRKTNDSQRQNRGLYYFNLFRSVCVFSNGMDCYSQMSYSLIAPLLVLSFNASLWNKFHPQRSTASLAKGFRCLKHIFPCSCYASGLCILLSTVSQLMVSRDYAHTMNFYI